MSGNKVTKGYTKKDIAGMLYAVSGIPEKTMAKILRISRKQLNQAWKDDPTVVRERERVRALLKKEVGIDLAMIIAEVKKIAMADVAEVSAGEKLKALFGLAKMFGEDLGEGGVNVNQFFEEQRKKYGE